LTKSIIYNAQELKDSFAEWFAGLNGISKILKDIGVP
jgi:hypothetical protein